jgi:hypothetical protein
MDWVLDAALSGDSGASQWEGVVLERVQVVQV